MAKKEKKEKKVLTPEQKKKRTIKAVAITLSIVLAIGIFFGACAIVNASYVPDLINLATSFNTVEYENQLVPVKDTDGYWTFTTDRDLKVVQITDVHIGAGCFSHNKDKWAMNAVAAMITAEKPDLVVVTGDIAYPVPFQAGTFNNMNAAEVFSKMMEKLGVYWTFCFGNHDTEAYSKYTREEICDWYAAQNYKYCLFSKGFYGEEKVGKYTNTPGYGNHIIKVKGTDGLVKQAIVVMDSHSYIDNDILGIAWKYDNLHPSQVDWYEAELDKLVAANKAIDATCPDVVANTAFFHIPLVEYRDAWKEYRQNGNKDTENVKYIYGVLGEDEDSSKNGIDTWGVFCGYHEDNFFEVGKENGLKAVFCGHDHYNNFSVEYKGVRLSYSYSIDYLAYATIANEQVQRGCTLITLKQDGTFDCELSNYYKKDADGNEVYPAQFSKK